MRSAVDSSDSKACSRACTPGQRWVSASASRCRSELSAVYVVQGEDVALRQVRLGRTYGDTVEVLAGLGEGDKVALDPVAAGIWLKEHAD